MMEQNTSLKKIIIMMLMEIILKITSRVIYDYSGSGTTWNNGNPIYGRTSGDKLGNSTDFPKMVLLWLLVQLRVIMLKYTNMMLV